MAAPPQTHTIVAPGLATRVEPISPSPVSRGHPHRPYWAISGRNRTNGDIDPEPPDSGQVPRDWIRWHSRSGGSRLPGVSSDAEIATLEREPGDCDEHE
jgi:hypothetical protein